MHRPAQRPPHLHAGLFDHYESMTLSRKYMLSERKQPQTLRQARPKAGCAQVPAKAATPASSFMCNITTSQDDQSRCCHDASCCRKHAQRVVMHRTPQRLPLCAGLFVITTETQLGQESRHCHSASSHRCCIKHVQRRVMHESPQRSPDLYLGFMPAFF